MESTLDTNILIDYLNGISEARTEIQRYERSYISIITWMEVLVGCNTKNKELLAAEFLSRFVLVPVSLEVASKAILIRKKHKIKLPDAIILATARSQKTILVTRNSHDFEIDNPEIRIPYKV